MGPVRRVPECPSASVAGMADNMKRITVDMVLEKLGAVPFPSISTSVPSSQNTSTWAERIKRGDTDGVKEDALQDNADITALQQKQDSDRRIESLKTKLPPPSSTAQPSNIASVLSGLISRNK